MKLLVTDAGPLIFLAKLGRLNLLTPAEVCVPAAVMAEISAKADEASRQIEQATTRWLKVVAVQNRAAVQLLLADLDLGEAEVRRQERIKHPKAPALASARWSQTISPTLASG